jgi:hypothetical protein
MGWLSSLAKIGGVVAAPFSGGASLALTGLGGALDGIGKAGAVMGGQQGGANNARVAQGQLDLSRDRNALDLYNSQQGAQFSAGQQDLQRKGFETSDRSSTAKQALIGALLGGKMDPTSIKGGVASGGLLRALQANPDALGAMQRLGGSAGQAQIKPLEFTGGQMVAPPSLSAPQKIDVGGGKLGALSKIMQVLGAFGGGGRPEEEQ